VRDLLCEDKYAKNMEALLVNEQEKNKSVSK
jgi:hypothetical protein